MFKYIHIIQKILAYLYQSSNQMLFTSVKCFIKYISSILNLKDEELNVICELN